jgi:hypothetical protein
VAPGIGVEVKCKGSLAAVTRQLDRYAAQDSVSALLLVTSRAQLIYQPASLGGKPVRVVHLLASAL